MAPKKKLTEEEIKEKKKEYARRRRDRIKNDPVLAAIEAEKERKKYEVKKMKKQVKLVKDMSNRELRQKRKEWREKSKKAYDKKKRHENLVTYLEERSPPNSDTEVQLVTDGRRRSGRKRVKKARSKVVRDNKRLIKENALLKKHVNKWRQKHWRLKNSLSCQNSPRTIVRKVLKKGNIVEVRRRLIFGEAIKQQLASNYKSLKSKVKKREFGTLVAGDAKLLRRYNLLSDLRGTISTKVFNNVRMLTNNKLLKLRVKKINDAVQQDVRQFFEDDEVSKLCPGKRDCLTKNKLKKQKRILTDTLFNLYPIFLKRVQYKIGYVSFCKLKPFWVVKQRASERDTCLCKTHANMELLTSAMFKGGIIDSADPKKFSQHICCDVTNVDCLQGKCSICKQLSIPYLLFDREASVSFFKWQTKNVPYLDKNGKTKMAKQILKDKITVSAIEAVDMFEASLRKFLYHEGNVIHQFRAIKTLKARLNEDEVLIHCDFSENYAMKYSSEVQAFHFGGSRKQFTLHTSEVYFKKDAYSGLMTQSFCTLSECLDHGPEAVWAHLQPVINFLKQSVTQIRMIHFLSDSPTTQYRNKTIFYLIAHALQHSVPVSVATWNYMEAGHGKGAPDGIGGCLKRTADRIVAQGQDIDSFQTFLKVLEDNVRRVKICVVTQEEIDSMKAVVPSSIPAFKGTMKVHQVVYHKESPDNLIMKSLSCFSCFECEHNSLGQHEIPGDQESDGCSEQVECDIEINATNLPNNEDWQSMASTSAHQTVRQTVSVANGYAPGSYILVKFQGSSKKNSKLYRYVCCVIKINDDGTVQVNGMRQYENKKNMYEIKDNDICLISSDDILLVLPPPNVVEMKRRVVFSFPYEIDVIEQ